MSLPFIFFFGMIGLSMVVFAVAWQQVLKHMSLTFAFTNKPITVIYALIWGVLIFHEKVTLKMVIGAAVILAGIVIGVSGND
jgi:drug/metabolite transporter (DMT)-like permease